MSIFRRDTSGSASVSSPSVPSSEPSSQRRRVTLIAAGSRIRGEVTGASELLVEGEVEGEIRIDSVVVVGAEGVVRGPIAAQTVRIGGRVIGSVHADRVEVSVSGSLEGDIVAPRIVIAEGAFFKGRVEMNGDNNESRGAEAAKDAGKAAAEPRKG
ncbi:MAG TPA: polymer-forming cytoskeletal protein [Thermoanaerobaculia bacterium]|nr:polymer-forming cytoskeletal protein [Thermoanaerobaculia bacterium]